MRNEYEGRLESSVSLFGTDAGTPATCLLFRLKTDRNSAFQTEPNSALNHLSARRMQPS